MGSCMGGYGLAPLHPPEQSSQVFIQLEQSSNFSRCSFGHVQSTNIYGGKPEIKNILIERSARNPFPFEQSSRTEAAAMTMCNARMCGDTRNPPTM